MEIEITWRFRGPRFTNFYREVISSQNRRKDNTFRNWNLNGDSQLGGGGGVRKHNVKLEKISTILSKLINLARSKPGLDKTLKTATILSRFLKICLKIDVILSLVNFRIAAFVHFFLSFLFSIKILE